MSNNFVLTLTTQLGLQPPKYFDTFTGMAESVISEFRSDLIENEATYKNVIDFDESIKLEQQWFDKDFPDDTFITIDKKRQQVTAKTSNVTNYGLEFFGEKIPKKDLPS